MHSKRNLSEGKTRSRAGGAAMIAINRGKQARMMQRLKMERGSGNVFREDAFSQQKAHNLLLRADLMMKVEQFVIKSGMAPQQAAQLLGVNQPRLNNLLKGKIENFSMDALVNMLGRAGMQVKMTVRKAG
jgi:predicted XRE-type DNA-binding protein